VDPARRLRRVLEPAVDLRIEFGEAPVHRLDHALQAAVDLGAAIRELRPCLRLEGREDARQPPRACGRRGEQEEDDDDDVDHRADKR
jgi:hypothetical protein